MAKKKQISIPEYPGKGLPRKMSKEESEARAKKKDKDVGVVERTARKEYKEAEATRSTYRQGRRSAAASNLDRAKDLKKDAKKSGRDNRIGVNASIGRSKNEYSKVTDTPAKATREEYAKEDSPYSAVAKDVFKTRAAKKAAEEKKRTGPGSKSHKKSTEAFKKDQEKVAKKKRKLSSKQQRKAHEKNISDTAKKWGQG